MAAVVGTVSDLSRYPVKSMLGENLDHVAVSEKGVAGDRAYALVDDETGKVVSVKRPKRWARMFELRAWTDPGGVRVSFPGGETLSIEDPQLSDRLSKFFGRDVSIIDTPPPDASYEEAWVGELKEGAPPYLGMESETIDGEEFIDGGAFMRGNKNFFDFGAVHIVTTASTNELARQAPESRFDPPRFRPNIVVDSGEKGFIENDWSGRTLVVGEVRLTVGIPVPRCVMTTLAQDELPADRNVLRVISKESRVDILGNGTPYPCLGVYADVVSNGVIALGDEVVID